MGLCVSKPISLMSRDSDNNLCEITINKPSAADKKYIKKVKDAQKAAMKAAITDVDARNRIGGTNARIQRAVYEHFVNGG